MNYDTKTSALLVYLIEKVKKIIRSRTSLHFFEMA